MLSVGTEWARGVGCISLWLLLCSCSSDGGGGGGGGDDDEDNGTTKEPTAWLSLTIDHAAGTADCAVAVNGARAFVVGTEGAPVTNGNNGAAVECLLSERNPDYFLVSIEGVEANSGTTFQFATSEPQGNLGLYVQGGPGAYNEDETMPCTYPLVAIAGDSLSVSVDCRVLTGNGTCSLAGAFGAEHCEIGP